MSDDRSKRGWQDRQRIAKDEPYEVEYFARKHGLSAGDARSILDESGPDRSRADEMAEGKRK